MSGLDDYGWSMVLLAASVVELIKYNLYFNRGVQSFFNWKRILSVDQAYNYYRGQGIYIVYSIILIRLKCIKLIRVVLINCLKFLKGRITKALYPLKES